MTDAARSVHHRRLPGQQSQHTVFRTGTDASPTAEAAGEIDDRGLQLGLGATEFPGLFPIGQDRAEASQLPPAVRQAEDRERQDENQDEEERSRSRSKPLLRSALASVRSGSETASHAVFVGMLRDPMKSGADMVLRRSVDPMPSPTCTPSPV